MTEATQRLELRPRGGRPGPDVLATERWVALIRLAVIGVVCAIYLGAQARFGAPSPTAIALLTFAVLYAVWSMVVFGGRRELSPWPRVLSILVDIALVAAWVQVTGGALSEYWGLYLVVLISVAMRFDLVEAVGTAVGIAMLYGALAMVDGRLPDELILHRTSLMVITGFAAGVLSMQRRVHRRRGQELEAVAEERTRELTVERQEVERLRRVDIAKSEFVAVAAHEFRTPLAAVIGVLSTIRDHGSVLTTAERLELIDGATAQATRLARLVDDLLTVARIEDGIVRLDLEPTDPRPLLADASQAAGMSTRLVVRIGRVGQVRCDRDSIVRVLTNLLDNARKYSPAGSKVHVTVSLEGDLVRFSIADEGPGVPPEERAEVFERFRRLDGGSSKPGAGLGLYICRGLVEAHGGSIRVDDGSCGGADFSFTLPRAVRAETEAVSVRPADDDPDVRLAPVADLSSADLPPAAVR